MIAAKIFTFYPPLYEIFSVELLQGGVGLGRGILVLYWPGNWSHEGFIWR